MIKVEGNGFDVVSDVVCSFGGVEVDADRSRCLFTRLRRAAATRF